MPSASQSAAGSPRASTVSNSLADAAPSATRSRYTGTAVVSSRKIWKTNPVADTINPATAHISSGDSDRMRLPRLNAATSPSATQTTPCTPAWPQNSRYPAAPPTASTAASQPVRAQTSPITSGMGLLARAAALRRNPDSA